MKNFLILCFICSVSFANGQNLKWDLVGHWPLDGDAIDISGNAYNGNINNAVPTMDRFSNPGGAMYFNGVAHINFGDIIDIGFGDVTFSAWVNFEPSVSERAIVSKTQHPSDYKIGIGINEKRPAAILRTPVEEKYVIHSTTVLDQQWHFFVATYDRDGFLVLYWDGEVITQTDISASESVDMQSPFDFIIGAGDANTSTNVNFTGSIDDVRIFDKVLSPSEVSFLFNKLGPGETVEPVVRNGSFQLEKGKKYIVSCWIREDVEGQVAGYTHTKLGVAFNGSNGFEYFAPSGAIIDGWQRIIGEFTVPSYATEFNFSMISEVPFGSSYFDDLRIVPFNGNMKSFVYDPETQQLVAELDENNYGTFYEYDQEGGLVRIKKETENGIYTIQETRSSNAKSGN